MKAVKGLLVGLFAIVLILLLIKASIQVEVDEDTLPVNVYEEDADLLTLVNTRLIDLFINSATNEYTVVEEVVNLIILDSIRENVNSEYDPLGDCETTECNYIVYDEY